MDMGVTLIVIAGIGAWYSMKTKGIDPGPVSLRKRRREEPASLMGAPGGSPREAELQQEVEQLRSRIQVLERIATDANTAHGRQTRALADEIESLRDR